VIIVDAEDVSASRPNRPLFAGVSLTVATGDRIGVVGLNGSGKTTLLRILSGELAPETGVVRRGRGARIGVLAQIPQLPDGTVADAVGHGWQGEAMLDRLGMGATGAAATSALSGGQRKRVALARLLVEEWDALILDEPTNHLDLDAISFLEEHLAEYRGGLVLVTHDRHVLDRVTTKVLELDRGRSYLHEPSERSRGSGYAAYLAGRAVREEQAATAEQARRNLARRELDWLRRGAPARSTKPKARVGVATAIVNRRAEPAARSGELDLSLGSQRLGSKGIELRGVAFAWPDGDDVLHGVELALDPGDRVGIVGPNGAGKSTLLDLVAGRLAPTAGTVDHGRTVKVGYYDQLGRDLDLNQRVRDAVAGDKGAPSLDDLALMRRFWFDGDAQFAPLGTLSGGERRRLQLLLTLLDQPNVLLLDEPTNDLDLDTLRALEDFLDDWPGIVVAVSHDRAFLDRTVERVVAIEDGTVKGIRGGVAGWLAARGAAAASGAPAPVSARPAPAPVVRRGASGPSPSTLRRKLAEVQRTLDAALARSERLSAQISAAVDHVELGRLSEELAAAGREVAAAEEEWLALATAAEEIGLALDR
jgi:ATP-binding cassette subfamily F protein uup